MVRGIFGGTRFGFCLKINFEEIAVGICGKICKIFVSCIFVIYQSYFRVMHASISRYFLHLRNFRVYSKIAVWIRDNFYSAEMNITNFGST